MNDGTNIANFLVVQSKNINKISLNLSFVKEMEHSAGRFGFTVTINYWGNKRRFSVGTSELCARPKENPPQNNAFSKQIFQPH